MSETEKRYLEATELSATLEPTHPLRLALSLNYAVFKYEIEQNFAAAVQIATLALNEAVTIFPSLEDAD